MIRNIIVALISILAVDLQGIAQTQKEALSLNDVRLWRTHSLSLSDNGQWFTTLYRLSDKSESKQDTILQQLIKKTSEQFYTDNNKTNVLYIHNAKSGLEYEIPFGSNPLFSNDSEWIAYKIRPEYGNDEQDSNQEYSIFIELKHLKSAYTIRYESDAKYSFPKGKSLFITEEKDNILVYDLETRREHYIGYVGEYLVDKKTPYIAYTINSQDKRGNGIYIYSPIDRITRSLATGNIIYANMAWNKTKNAIAAYTYNKKDESIDEKSVSLIIIDKIDTKYPKVFQYPVKDIQGMPEKMTLAAKLGNPRYDPIWSNDDERLFVKLKQAKKNSSKKNKSKNDDVSSLQIWHWKDKKLLSERIMEHDEKQNEVYDAIFHRNNQSIIQLTGEDIQNITYSKGADQWAIGLDNRKYISDWDVEKNDLYRVNLRTGEKKLIQEEHSRSYWSPNYQISPDGDEVILWDGKDYWYYSFESDTKKNITKDLEVSFIDEDYDKFGYVPDYGFTGWVKDRNVVIVNHKHDLWVLPTDGKSMAQNLTASVTSRDSIRFRLEDSKFTYEEVIEDRYIDLSTPLILDAYNTQTRYAGFYELKNAQLKRLIYEPVSFFHRPWGGFKLLKSKYSNKIIYVRGDYQNYPEAYLSTSNFSNPKKITNTNPQQKKYKWGKRILIDYTNDEGVPLQGILSIPESYNKGDKLPMIVHSYETFSWRRFIYAAPYLSGASVPEMLYVSDGYLFLQPDIHFYVGTPHSDMHESIDAAIRKVIELGYVDDKRIGYEGFSFGGHCGMYISTQKNKFAAIAAGAGVSNLVQGFNIDIVRDGSNEQDYYMTGQGRLGTDPTSNTEMYIRESPVFNAQTMDTPLLLFHGTEDKVVQWEHSFGFYSILRYLKKPVVFLSYLNEGHGLRKEANRLDIQRKLKAFFDFYLKDAAPEKWMIEELPYNPEKKSKSDKTKRTVLPKWK